MARAVIVIQIGLIGLPDMVENHQYMIGTTVEIGHLHDIDRTKYLLCMML